MWHERPTEERTDGLKTVGVHGHNKQTGSVQATGRLASTRAERAYREPACCLLAPPHPLPPPPSAPAPAPALPAPLLPDNNGLKFLSFLACVAQAAGQPAIHTASEEQLRHKMSPHRISGWLFICPFFFFFLNPSSTCPRASCLSPSASPLPVLGVSSLLAWVCVSFQVLLYSTRLRAADSQDVLVPP